MTDVMTEQRAGEVLERYPHKWGELEGAWPEEQGEMEELAAALAWSWREHWQEPGFMQPPRWLVERVEELIEERVWPE